MKKRYIMKYLLLCLCLCCLFSCRQKNDTMHMPAEWEPHSAVWFGWEEELHSLNSVSAEIIKIIAPKVKVKISVSSDSVLSVARKFMFEQGIDTSKLEFYILPGDRFWIRDYGPTFLIDEEGKLGATDFIFDANGNTNWFLEKYNNNIRFSSSTQVRTMYKRQSQCCTPHSFSYSSKE